jgi:general secretion pathway protein A
MYKEYFRLREMPFSIAPDPRFLFMSDRYREALAHLLYGIQCEGGIVLLTGEVGTGKTTICRCLLEQIPADVEVAFILNPRMNVEELLKTACEEFHIEVPAGRQGLKGFVDAIYTHLMAGNALGRRSILIIDEAQNLEPAVIEQLRLLTNLETNTRKLLQIILIGQPELQDILARPEMRQVAQRVVAHYHLVHLSEPEVRGYVAHRLSVSGAPSSIIPASLIKPLHRATEGVPRLINLVCDRALLGTYTQGLQQVSKATLRQAIREIAVTRPPRRRWLTTWALAILAALVAVLLLIDITWNKATGDAESVSAAAAGTPAAEQATPPAAAVPAVLDPLAWPEGVAHEESESLAFRTMFDLFGLHFDPSRGGDACHQAEGSGMRCYAGQGGLTELRLLDQPALLSMVADDGQPYSVALLGMDSEVAKIAIAGIERRVAIARIAAAWNGNFIVLWRPPAAFGNGLVPNQYSPAVAWLRESLARIDGLPPGSGTVLDAGLARRLRSFQQAEGLQPDGRVGSRTAIRLNVRSGAGGPRLTADLKD